MINIRPGDDPVNDPTISQISTEICDKMNTGEATTLLSGTDQILLYPIDGSCIQDYDIQTTTTTAATTSPTTPTATTGTTRRVSFLWQLDQVQYIDLQMHSNNRCSNKFTGNVGINLVLYKLIQWSELQMGFTIKF